MGAFGHRQWCRPVPGYADESLQKHSQARQQRLWQQTIRTDWFQNELRIQGNHIGFSAVSMGHDTGGVPRQEKVEMQYAEERQEEVA